MEFVLFFFFGYVAAMVGVIPPGLLNMTAAKISLKENRRNAFLFSLGVIVTVAFQTYLALIFARYLDKHPEVISVLQEVGLGIFICITLYFFFIAKDKKSPKRAIEPRSKQSRFFHGLFLASRNVFPIPYWVYLSITFVSFGWFQFTKSFICLCVLGSSLGTLTMLVVYAHYFKRIQENRKEIKMNMNYVIGTITAIVAIITLIKIINDL